MKKLILTLIAVLIAVPSYAQCVAEVKDVLIDEARGSIIIETQYSLNGTVVDTKANPDKDAIGRTRYTEESGTIAEIVVKAKADINQHCENLIVRNAKTVRAKMLEIQKAKTTPMIADLKTNAVGFKMTVTSTSVNYKDKEITVNANGTYSVADAQ